MPIVTNSNAIPKEFINTDIIPISNEGKNRLKNILKLKGEFVSNRDEILDLVFKTSLKCCELYFNKNKDVSFDHGYMRNGLEVRSGESSIFMNDTLLQSLSHFIHVVIYHSLDFDNAEVSLYCYRELLFIMNEQCNNTYLLPGENRYIGVLEKFPDIKTLNVASDLYWGMITFLILHELSHIFLNHHNIDKGQAISEQEQDADRNAYLIFLEMIYNKSLYKELEFLEEYIYLSPMMIIDFFTLVYFVDGTINEARYTSCYPSHEKRKDLLLKLFNDWDRDFNTEEGNIIYNWYIEVVEKFKNDLYNANEQGMLKSIKRNSGERMNEENILGFISEIVDELIVEDKTNGILDRASISCLLDSYVCFIADDSKRDFVLVNRKNGTAKSFKLTNIIVNFRDMLDMLIDITLTSAIPSSTVQAVKFILFLTYKVLGLSTENISESATQVLLFLHQNNAYSRAIQEDEVFKHFDSQGSIKMDAINIAIKDLLKIRCIDIVQGKIVLLEKIYLK
ncbi:MAG: hypothetical protein LBK66_14795 [Spirochaetaceae bacterium]|nr:hypothetical protein [Spirochaetaceae bacterium]